MIQPLWKTVWRFLKKLGIKPPYDPTIPPLGIYPEETKIEKGTCTTIFIEALFTMARTWKQPKCLLGSNLKSKEKTVNQNKPDTKDHILYGSIYTKCPK